MCSKFIIKPISWSFLVILYTLLEISCTPSLKKINESMKQVKAPLYLVKFFHLWELLLLFWCLSLYWNCDKGPSVLQKVKKDRKVALIFPKPDRRENLHILQVYEISVESLLKWPAEEGHPRSRIGELESAQVSSAVQQREREGKLRTQSGKVPVEPRRWGGWWWH